MAERRTQLVYVGPGYTAMSSTQIKDRVVNTGASDFLMITVERFNLVTAGDPILRMDWIKANIPDSAFKPGTRAWTETKLTGEINQYNATTGNTLQLYMAEVMRTANLICQHKPNAKIWVGMPSFLPSAQPVALRYQYYYHEYIMNQTQTMVNSSAYPSITWNHIAGFYFGQEDISSAYTPFTANAPGTNFGNSVVACMKYLSDAAHNLSKQFMWIPFFNPNGTSPGSDSGIRIGYIVNQTKIFDVVMLQPSYFKHPENKFRLGQVETCVEKKKIWYNNSLVGSQSLLVPDADRADIGPEMEIDMEYKDDKTDPYYLRYMEYVDAYEGFLPSHPVGFYCGGTEVIMRTDINTAVKDFFSTEIV